MDLHDGSTELLRHSFIRLVSSEILHVCFFPLSNQICKFSIQKEDKLSHKNPEKRVSFQNHPNVMWVEEFHLFRKSETLYLLSFGCIFLTSVCVGGSRFFIIDILQIYNKMFIILA